MEEEFLKEVRFMNAKRKLLVSLIVLIGLGAYYYMALPAVNIHSSDTWFMIMFVIVALAAIYVVRKRSAGASLRKTGG